MKLTVDLASKFSAAMVVDLSGKVHREFDSMGKTAFEFAEEVAQTALDCEVTDVIVEDVPYGISGQAQVKPVFRLQGILIRELGGLDLLESTWFLNPTVWMALFPGVARAPKGLSKADGERARYAAARAFALEAGYTPPPLAQNYIDSLPAGKRALAKDLKPLFKSETDYIDARLIAEWANSFDNPDELHAKMQMPLI